jgi:hypothetical protein
MSRFSRETEVGDMRELLQIGALVVICGLCWCYLRFQEYCWMKDREWFKRSAYASRLVRKEESQASSARRIERYADPASTGVEAEEEKECSTSST